jgi:hypothetical protein
MMNDVPPFDSLQPTAGDAQPAACHFCGPDQQAPIEAIRVCDRCAAGYCAGCEICKFLHGVRLDSARALLTELNDNALTPYREKIRAWLAQSD